MTTAIDRFVLLQRFPCILHTKFNIMHLCIELFQLGLSYFL